MIFGGEFVNGVDLVDISLWGFTLFFFGLVFYLRREDRREGYPLEADTTGRLEDDGAVWYAPKKEFNLPHDRGTLTAAHGKRDSRNLAMARMAVWPGAPYQPTGDPMRDGVGPASFAERADIPDLTIEGANRLTPLRLDHALDVAKNDADPRGMTVYGADGVAAGEVVDLWADRSDVIIRYLEIALANDSEADRVLLPIAFATIDGRRRRVVVDAVFGHHFKYAPRTKSPDTITRLEEDKIAGYFGGGKLYATPSRLEPLA